MINHFKPKTQKLKAEMDQKKRERKKVNQTQERYDRKKII